MFRRVRIQGPTKKKPPTKTATMAVAQLRRAEQRLDRHDQQLAALSEQLSRMASRHTSDDRNAEDDTPSALAISSFSLICVGAVILAMVLSSI